MDGSLDGADSSISWSDTLLAQEIGAARMPVRSQLPDTEGPLAKISATWRLVMSRFLPNDESCAAIGMRR